MDDFGSVIYLDVEKTGSSFVSKFLAAVLPDAPRRFVKHGRLDRPVAPGECLVTSVREPVAQWLSLYQFGVEAGGPVRRRLSDWTDAPFRYDGRLEDFIAWADHLLDPAHADRLGGRYAMGAPHLVGYQTFRFLRLNLDCPPRRLRRATTRAEVAQLAEAHLQPARVVRTETLRSDLAEACRSWLRPYLADPEWAATLAHDLPAEKVAQHRAFQREELPDALVRRIVDREWWLIERFYPEHAARSANPGRPAAAGRFTS